MRKIIIILIFNIKALLILSQVQCQPKNLLSPNAASLGEYGVVPVSPYTGKQNISIPLYDISIGNHNIPITLSYYAGGVRVEQLPGWTGMGWTLNAGGCISRIVNDNSDEFYAPLSDTNSREIMGYFYHSEYFNHKQLVSGNENSIWLENAKNAIRDYWDIAPDKFQFNFLGYSGVFYWTPENKWKILCDKPIKVEFDYENGFTDTYSKTSEKFNLEWTNRKEPRSVQFKIFTIIGEDGTKYVFGGNDDAIEFSIGLFNQHEGHMTATTWHLSQIIYPDSRKVSFKYEHSDFIAQMYLNRYNEYTDDGITANTTAMSIDNYNGELILPSYLKEISSDYIKIKLTKDTCNYSQKNCIKQLCDRYANAKYQSTDWSYFMPILAHNGVYTSKHKDYPSCLAALRLQKLKSIDVYSLYNNASARIRNINFEYTDNENQRLRLDLLSIGTDEDLSSQAKYKFEYNHSELLPDYLYNKTDHWGFYNNRESVPITSSNYESTREPSSSVAQYGMLTKITYPTGGYNKFEYESHDYLKKVQESREGVELLPQKKIAGGVRIKKIINSPTGLVADEYIDKEYFYVTDFLTNGVNSTQSSGILTQLYKYSHIGQVFPEYNGFGFITVNTHSSLSFLPSIGNITNNHIEYSEVVERNNDNSFTIYQYTNFSDGHHDLPNILTLSNQQSIYEPTNARDQERGLLKSVKEYNSNNQIQRSVSYEYERSGSLENNYVPIYKFRYGSTRSKTWIMGSLYYAYTYTIRPKTLNETVYNGNDSLITGSSYSYNSLGLVNTILTRQSDGSKKRVTYKYPSEFCSITDAKYNEMQTANRLSPIVESHIEEIDESGIATPLIKTFYHYDKNILNPSSISIAVGSGNYEHKVSYIHDNFGNIINEVPIDGPEVSHIWGYCGTRLLASTYKTPYPFIASIINTFNDYSSKKTPDLTKLTLIRNHFQCGGIIIYNYNRYGQLYSTIDKTGNKTYYQYDSLGRLVAVKDEDGKYIEVYNYNYSH